MIYRLSGIILLVLSFVEMELDVYGWVLFATILAGIILMCVSAWVINHNEECKPI